MIYPKQLSQKPIQPHAKTLSKNQYNSMLRPLVIHLIMFDAFKVMTYIFMFLKMQLHSLFLTTKVCSFMVTLHSYNFINIAASKCIF